jgi:putative proteasome-type protease
MSYCLAILTRSGLVFASDSRTNAGLDRVNVARKTFTFVTPGERAFILLTSGGLSLSQSVVALLRAEFDAGRGLATAVTMYDAARAVGDAVRRVSDLDRPYRERDNMAFNVNFLVGGQVRGGDPDLFLIDPQGTRCRRPWSARSCRSVRRSKAGRSTTGRCGTSRPRSTRRPSWR